MNELIYCLLNKFHGNKVIDNIVLEKLYYFYERKSNTVRANIYISREDFNKIISTMYDVLRFSLNDDEFIEVIINYLSLLIVDAKADNIVDINWFIKYIWYLGINSANSAYAGYFNADLPNVEKFSDCIPFIQNKLISKFNIEEATSKKIKRKVYTKLMIKQ